MDLDQSKPRRVRVHRTAEFKARLIKLATAPGASVAGVVVAHGVNPNLLRRWLRESGSLSMPAQFVPVVLENLPRSSPQIAASASDRIEVNIDRGDLRIAFKVDPSQMVELGQVLREVLR
jgi:transposase